MPKKLIGEILIEKKLITIGQLKHALEIQVESGHRLGDILVELGYIKSGILDKVLTKDSVDIKDISISQSIINLIPLAYANKHILIPFKKTDNLLFVAMADPYNFTVIDDIKFRTNLEVHPVGCVAEDIKQTIKKHYGLELQIEPDLIKHTGSFKKEIDAVTGQISTAGEEAPVSRFVSLIIQEAFKRRASDIHLESIRDCFRIRYRIDGVLHEIFSLDKSMQGVILARIKLMADMDISEKRFPQDGRIRYNIGAKSIDLRVSSLPDTHGESIVLRVLDKSNVILGVDELGFLKKDKTVFNKLLSMPNGVILVTGPTGSGKTTTLYAALNYLNKPDKKLITVEDPVEYQIFGINQIQVRQKIGLDFARVLRTILRQAPDIIMIGEIRDHETADITMQSALTGHLVFSTLHTNDSASAIVRLMDMGVQPYLISSSLQAVLSQRLVRKICDNCKQEYKPTEAELKVLGITSKKKITLYKGKGCELCSKTGYRGRIGIFELLVVNEQIKDLIYKKALSLDIRNAAMVNGMKTLRSDGVEKVLNGITTVSEVLRVANEV
jgi:type IV pilus assembly protein PilB